MNYKHVVALILFLVVLGCGGGGGDSSGGDSSGGDSSGGDSSGDDSSGGDSSGDDSSGDDSSGDDSGGGDTARPPVTSTEGLNSPENTSSVAANTIAYISSSRKRNSIRLIQSDGSNDKLLWTAPENLLISPQIGTLAWRPDGTELAFDSDHAFGMSFYGRDLYAITADGSYLRKITNPPETRYFETLPKGGATLYSRNWLDGGANFWAYIEGSSTNVTWLAASAKNWKISFNDVADFGDGIRQYAVVGYFGYNGRRMCRYDLAGSADIVAGESIEIAQNFDSWDYLFMHCLTVRQPSWNYNGEKILFTTVSGVDHFSDGPSVDNYENYSITMSHSENLSPGNKGAEMGLFEQTYSNDPKHIKLSPTEEEGLLLVIRNYYADRIYLSSTSDSDMDTPDRLQRIDLGFCNYGDDPSFSVDTCHISDIEWLPDSSGFIVSMLIGTGNRFDQQERFFYRVYKHDLNTGNTDMLVHLENEYIGDITVSPSADKIAFERGRRYDGPYDIWIYDIEDDDLHMLVEDASAPAWTPL